MKTKTLWIGFAFLSEFLQEPTMQTLRWLRIVGDTVFAAGSVALAVFVIGLKTGWSIDKTKKLYQD